MPSAARRSSDRAVGLSPDESGFESRFPPARSVTNRHPSPFSSFGENGEGTVRRSFSLRWATYPCGEPRGEDFLYCHHLARRLSDRAVGFRRMNPALKAAFQRRFRLARTWQVSEKEAEIGEIDAPFAGKSARPVRIMALCYRNSTLSQSFNHLTISRLGRTITNISRHARLPLLQGK